MPDREPSPDPAAARLRQVEAAEAARWQSFYNDRARPCPFFGADPDENLVEWIGSGRIGFGRALDIGCGNGRNTIHLAATGLDAEGIDLSAQAITWARERAAASGVAARFVCASIWDRPPAARSLDLVYDSGCFHHMPPHRRQAYIDLVAQTLKPGGHFGLVCFAPEAGSGLSDGEVYQRGSLGGGLGYADAALRQLWGASLEVLELRRMIEQPPDAGRFGKGFLWVMLARAR